MAISVPEPSFPLAGSARPRATVASSRLPRWFEDRIGLVASLLYIIVVVWYEHYPLEHISSVCSCQNSDPTQWMWAWRWVEYAITHGLNPLKTNLLWPGQPFDLASITLAPITAIPGIPLEALFGPIAAYNLLACASPVICGWSAYRLCRYISGAPWASVVAGYTYGFSAYELGHLFGHINLLPVFVPPMLVLLVLRYVDGEVSRRRVVLSTLGLLLIQFGLSTEILFDLSYTGFVALVVAWIVTPLKRRKLLEAAGLLALGYILMGIICCYYIYEQVHGPQESGNSAPGYPADLMSYIFPTPTFRLGSNRLAGLAGGFITSDFYEQNSYLGIPLIGVLLAVIFTAWRQARTKVIAITAFFAFVMSLGPQLVVQGIRFFELPYGWLLHLPFFNEAYPSRIGLLVALCAAPALALWLSWAVGRRAIIWRWIVAAAVIVFLFPNPSVPNRINTPANPTFFTDNTYKRYIRPHEIVMTIPFSQSGDEMLWQAETGMYFRLAGGYLGFPPPQYASIPIVLYQLYEGAPTPMPLSTAVRQLRAFVVTAHIGVVLVQQDDALNWAQGLRAAHFRLKALTGGIEVWDLPLTLPHGKQVAIDARQ